MRRDAWSLPLSCLKEPVVRLTSILRFTMCLSLLGVSSVAVAADWGRMLEDQVKQRANRAAQEAVDKGLDAAEDNDIIIISDLDEIPHIQNFTLFRSAALNNKYFAMSQLHYVYYLNVHVYEKHWVGSVVTQKKSLKHHCPQDFRNAKDNMKRIPCGGWHLSYLGGAASIFDKFKTSCDVLPHERVPEPQEIKELLAKRITEGQFNIRHLHHNNEPVCLLDEPYLPSPAFNPKYAHLFIKDVSDIKL
jgi:hypothetical protein